LKNKKLFLLVIFILALALRVVYMLTLEDRIYWPDGWGYDTVAQNVIAGRGYILTLDFPMVAVRAPGYPTFLGLIYLLTGHSLLMVRLMQAVVSALTVAVVYCLGKRVFNERAGRIAGVVACFYPFFIYYSGYVLTETLFIFLLALSMLLLVKTLDKTSLKLQIITGCLWGIAALTRPVALLVLPFILFWLGLGRLRYRKPFLKEFTVIFLFMLMTIAPWTIRNYIVLGEFVPVTTQGGWVLYESNNPLATGGTWENVRPPIMDELEGLSETEWNRYLSKAAKKYIREHPGRFLALAVRKQLRFWSLVPNAYTHQSWKYKLISLGSYGLILPLAVLGIFLSLKKSKKAAILFLPVLCFALIHMIFLGSIRYRVPIMPYMIIFAAYGIGYLYDKRRNNYG